MGDVLPAAVRPANLQGVRPERGCHYVDNGPHPGMAADLGGVVEHAEAGKDYFKNYSTFFFKGFLFF